MPFSDDAEKGILSCFLHTPTELLDDAQHRIPVDAFYHPANRRLYAELLEMHEMHLPVEYIALSQRLQDKGDMDKIGGQGALAELLDFVPTPTHYGYYTGIVMDKYSLRRLIAACDKGKQSCYEFQEDVPACIDTCQREVLAVSVSREEKGPVAAHVIFAAAMDRIEAQAKHPGAVTGLPCGLADIDRMLNGFEPKDRVIIAARPSVGKTALLMSMANHFCNELQAPGLIFSLDGDSTALGVRGIGLRSGVSLTKMRAGFITNPNDGASVGRAGLAWQKSPLFIDDRPGVTIQEMATIARRWKKNHGIQWVAVDFFQKMKSGSNRAAKGDLRIELVEASQGWMNMVMELDLCGIMLAQLNRDAEGRKSRPTMADIKECGAADEDATKIILLSPDHRGSDAEGWAAILKDDEIDSKDRQTAPSPRHDDRFVIAEVVKNKDGPTGPVWLRLRETITRFESFVPGKKLYASAHNKEGRKAHVAHANDPTC